MPRELSDKGRQLLADLSPDLSADAMTQQTIDALARELQRVEDRGHDIVQHTFPQNADDTYNTLPILERLLGLSVKPAGVSVDERRAVVLAHIRKRTDGSGAQWVHLLSQALGNIPWTHQEGPGAYQITIKIPYDPASFSAGQVASLAREITPAHLDLATGYNEGFLVGISQIGVDVL